MSNIVEVASKAGNFKTLIKAAKAAGLAETLSTGGPFTIFAPNDDAFSKIPSKTLNSLLKDPNELKKILLYHAIEGRIKSKDLSGKMDVKTVNGEKVTINAKKGVKVNDAKVIKADIEADNGIIHVIDRVIMPP